jgi:hypothetical protein
MKRLDLLPCLVVVCGSISSVRGAVILEEAEQRALH